MLIVLNSIQQRIHQRISQQVFNLIPIGNLLNIFKAEGAAAL